MTTLCVCPLCDLIEYFKFDDTEESPIPGTSPTLLVINCSRYRQYYDLTYKESIKDLHLIATSDGLVFKQRKRKFNSAFVIIIN